MTKPIPAGQTQRTRKAQPPGNGNQASFKRSSANARSARQAHPTNTAVRNPPIGSAKSFHTVAINVRKSMPIPGRAVRTGTAPFPRADGMASTNTPEVTVTTARLRDQPCVSTQCATGTSRSEIVDVRAAIASRMKNAAPNRWPPGRVPNRRGRTVKIRPGPLLLGSNPEMEKPDGKMMKPASRATAVSSATTHRAAVAIPTRLSR